MFFDTSVYVAALLSPKGAAGELIQLAEYGSIQMVVSERVIIESDNVLSRKFPDIVEESRKLWKNIAPEIASEPTQAQVKRFKKILPFADAAILCSAHLSNSDAFVTWNTRDFMKTGIKNLVSFPIVVPGDGLKLFRKSLAAFLD